MKTAVGKVIVCLTVDVEDSDIESLLRIKEISQKYNAPITWFVCTKQCNQPEALNLLSTFVEGGDEVGLHIHWKDSYALGLRSVPIEELEVELADALENSKPYFQVISFRGGGLCQTTPVLEILEQKGFEFDSSVAYKLNERDKWHQGHENVSPVSAYYPSQRDYDIIAYDDSERSTILEIPVTRGVPSPRYWCNLLEPGPTPLSIMGLTFRQYYVRRHFQPLVLMVPLLHSWAWQRYPTTLDDLAKFLSNASKCEVEFNTIRKAGYEWRKIWEEHATARNTLLSSQFHSDLKTRLEVEWFKLVMSIHNWRGNPGYHIRTLMSACYGKVLDKLSIMARLGKRVRR